MLLVLCLASLAPLMTPQDTLSSPNVEQDTSGRAAVDFTITDVAVGNSTEPAEIWEQPDGTSLDYMLRNVRYEVKITFKNAGTGSFARDSIGTLEAVHPIGFVMEGWTFNLTGQQGNMQGGQSREMIVEWTPDSAHSILDDDGHLHGGVIFRGTIT